MAKSVLEQTGLPDVFGDDVFTPPIINPGYSDPLEAGRVSIEQGREALSGAKYSLGDYAKATGKVLTNPKLILDQAGRDLNNIVAKPVADTFVRGVFVATGALFVGVGLISLSRSASEGAIEGIVEGLKG